MTREQFYGGLEVYNTLNRVPAVSSDGTACSCSAPRPAGARPSGFRPAGAEERP